MTAIAAFCAGGLAAILAVAVVLIIVDEIEG